MQKGNHRRILVVDDSAVVLKSVCKLLTRLGYETIAAQDGAEALRIMETDDGFNLVLTDINMPLIDGWELALRIKSTKPDMPIIALTGEHPDNVLPKIRGSGISHVLFKPFHLGHLNTAMVDVFGSGWNCVLIKQASTQRYLGTIPDAVIFAEYRLSDEAFGLQKTHAPIGHDIIKQIGKFDESIARGALEHHERVDGSG